MWRAALAFCGALCATALAAQSEDTCPATPPGEINVLAEFSESVGLPSLTDDTTAGEGIETVCEARFCYAHSAATKAPLWVMQKMTRAIVCGDSPRPSGWRRAKVTSPKARNSDYTHSGYARGHNAASADFKSSRAWMKQTFTFGNAVPQIQDGFNGSYWKYLEENLQDLARAGRDMYVITGPIPLADDGKPFALGHAGDGCKGVVQIAGQADLRQSEICGGTKAEGARQSCEAGVAVPAGLFKVIYLRETGRMFAYAAANIDHRPEGSRFDHHEEYLETWRVSLRAIEEATNLTFFPNLDRRRARQAKESCIATPSH